jgi:hypothetical protein
MQDVSDRVPLSADNVHYVKWLRRHLSRDLLTLLSCCCPVSPNLVPVSLNLVRSAPAVPYAVSVILAHPVVVSVGLAQSRDGTLRLDLPALAA